MKSKTGWQVKKKTNPATPHTDILKPQTCINIGGLLWIIFFSLSSLSLPILLILAFWFFSFGLQRSVEFWIMMKGMSRAQGSAIRIEVNNDYCLFKWLLVWKTSMPKIRRVNTRGLQRFNEQLRYRFLRWKSSPLTLCYTLV